MHPCRKLTADLHGTREFEEILAAVREATQAVSHSSPAFQVAEGDLAPESIAYDPNGKHFYFGSMKKEKQCVARPLDIARNSWADSAQLSASRHTARDSGF
jgi:hypothetical protein